MSRGISKEAEQNTVTAQPCTDVPETETQSIGTKCVYERDRERERERETAGSNLAGIASQFANQILGTANQLRNAEQKSANQKNHLRSGAIDASH